MEVFEYRMEQAKVSLSLDELLVLNAALNEVSNGIEVFEFETRIGATRDEVASLLKSVRALIDEMERK